MVLLRRFWYAANGAEYAERAKKIDAIDVASSTKTVASKLEAVQLTHRIDMDLSDAMQNTERCERADLEAEKHTLTLPGYSITRLKITGE